MEALGRSDAGLSNANPKLNTAVETYESKDKPSGVCVWPWILIALILLLAARLRTWQLGRESFWLDEVFSVESAMGRGFAHRLLPTNTLIERVPAFTDPARAAPWWNIWPACRGKTGDIHPPLPYILLRWWCDLFGFSDAAVRSFSAMCSVAAIGLLFFIGRELHGVGVALWACLLMAVASPQIQYAQEAKHYALLQAIALASCLALVRIEKRGASARRLIGLGTGVLALLFTHYLSIAPIAAMGLYAILRLRGDVRKRVMLAFILAGTFFSVAWGPTMLAQLKDGAGEADYFVDGGSGYLVRELQRLVSLPYRFLNEPLPNAESASYFMSVICLLPLLMVRRRPELLIWAIWVPLVILTVLLIDLARHSWLLSLIRYTLVAAPGVYLVLSAIGSGLRPALRHVLPLMCVGSCLVSLPGAYSQHKSNVRGMARALMSVAKPGDVTVYCSIWRPKQNVYHYFIATSFYARPMPGPVVLMDHAPDFALLSQLRARGKVWVIADSDELQEFLPGARIDTVRYFPNDGCLLMASWPALTASSPPADH